MERKQSTQQKLKAAWEVHTLLERYKDGLLVKRKRSCFLLSFASYNVDKGSVTFFLSRDNKLCYFYISSLNSREDLILFLCVYMLCWC